jgi:hypothetical protein
MDKRLLFHHGYSYNILQIDLDLFQHVLLAKVFN